MTDREAMQQALEALEQSKTLAPFGAEGVVYWEGVKIHEAAIATLRERLAHCDRCGKKLGGPDDIHTCSPQQPEQEPAQQPVQEPVYWEVRCTAHPKWMRVDEQQFDEYLAHGWEGQRLYTSPSQRKPEQEPVAWEDVLGAIARGWTHDDNKHKTMDVQLAVAIAKEIQDMVIAPPQRKPPQFPTMLRKMWSGAEVQKWINENWEQA